MALTLRLLCGLTTAEVARAFLTSEATMAARITRAKKKITATRIPYRVPGPDQLPGRLVGYHYLPAARAGYLRRLGRLTEARLAYDEALLLAGNTTERYLTARRAGLDA